MSTVVSLFRLFPGCGAVGLPPGADSGALFHYGGIRVFTRCSHLQPWHFGQHHWEVLGRNGESTHVFRRSLRERFLSLGKPILPIGCGLRTKEFEA